MPTNWQSKEVIDRLMAAVIASFDNKINYTRIARLYGDSVNYDAIKNFMRIPKKIALQLKAEDESRSVSSPAKPRTKKGGDASLTKGAVQTGRVTKKKAAAPNIKSEVVVKGPEDDMTVHSGSGGEELHEYM
ncbi:hypothetical protein EJ02DRAFT_354917 [Clathrospora elynae]|uniref:Uncharacterized protein n=1 Tax=Clathrospora elynae TaxID=706981 RepID=A0A6A5SIC4_9PLEO|nr:hypothetical protein EJ02DRAFT_354917 [Clathrospora elynae]